MSRVPGLGKGTPSGVFVTPDKVMVVSWGTV